MKAHQPQLVKIIDGIYIADQRITEDLEFLIANKLTFIINCQSQTPNYYRHLGLHYLKFKIAKNKPYVIYGKNLSKIEKMESFMADAMEFAECCIFSGDNRATMMLIAYLMSHYRWRLQKTLQYVHSKVIFSGLKEHNFNQLLELQKCLIQQELKPPLSENWKSPYLNEEQQLLSKTYLNTLSIPISQPKKPNNKRRVTWLEAPDELKPAIYEQQIGTRQKSKKKNKTVQFIHKPHKNKNKSNLSPNCGSGENSKKASAHTPNNNENQVSTNSQKEKTWKLDMVREMDPQSRNAIGLMRENFKQQRVQNPQLFGFKLIDNFMYAKKDRLDDATHCEQSTEKKVKVAVNKKKNKANCRPQTH